MVSALRVNRAKLLIAIWVLVAGILFDISAQTIAVRAQNPTNHWLTDRMAVLIQALANISQATVEPFLVAEHPGQHQFGKSNTGTHGSQVLSLLAYIPLSINWPEYTMVAEVISL
jgi:hypothetical protein